MKSAFRRGLLGLLTALVAASHPVQAQDKTNDDLKAIYQQAGWVFAGKFVKSEKYDRAGVEPQTIYTFEDCTHFKEKRGFGPIKTGAVSAFGVYGVARGLGQTGTGKRYVVLLSVDYGEVLASIPETPERSALLKDWARNGTYSPEELAKLRAKAGWVLTVEKAEERCLTSFPCQHSWTFPVVKALKGDNVPAKLTLRGSYKKHGEVPAPFKVTSASGKLLLFVEANGKTDTSLLGAIPWSEEMEKRLTN